MLVVPATLLTRPFRLSVFGRQQHCIKTCGDNTAIDCGGSSTSLTAKFDFGEIDNRQARLFERPPKPKPSNFFPGVELSQLLFALSGD